MAEGITDPLEWYQEFLTVSDVQAQPETCEVHDGGYTLRRNVAFAESLRQNQGFQIFVQRAMMNNAVTNTTKKHGITEPIDLFRVILKSTNKEALADDPTYPSDYATTDSHHRIMDRIAVERPFQNRVLNNLHLPIASSPSGRAKGFKAAIKLYGLEGPLSFGDLGCGAKHVIKRLAGEATIKAFAFDTSSVMQRDAAGNLIPDPRRERAINRLVTLGHLAVGPSYAMDLIDVDDDPGFAAWARSNTMYMGQLLDKDFVALYDSLAAFKMPNLTYVFADMADYRLSELPLRPDITMMSMSAWELTDDGERRRAFRLAEASTKHLVIVHDAMELDDNGDLRRVVRQDDYNDGLWVKNMQDNVPQWHKLFSFETPRMKRWIVEDAAKQLPFAATYGLD